MERRERSYVPHTHLYGNPQPLLASRSQPPSIIWRPDANHQTGRSKMPFSKLLAATMIAGPADPDTRRTVARPVRAPEPTRNAAAERELRRYVRRQFRRMRREGDRRVPAHH
jgi:hypothetical protein